MSSLVCTGPDVPIGASFRLLTFSVIVLGFTDRLFVAALSSTWKVKVVSGVPLLFARGVNRRFGMLATVMKSLTFTELPPTVRLPLAGSEVIFTRVKVFAATELGPVGC